MARSFLITSGKRLLQVGGSSRTFEDLPSFSGLPPVVLGNSILYVPEAEGTVVVQGSRRFEFESAIHALTVHLNNIYVLTSQGLWIIDNLSETKPYCFPVTSEGCFPTMMSSTGTSLILASNSHLWSFNLESLTLESICVPSEACVPFSLTHFSTVFSGSETYTVRGLSLERGSNEPSWSQAARCLQVPGHPDLQIDGLEDVTFISPVPEQEIPEDCMICMCEFEGEPSVTLYCGHAFHTDCILECLKKCEEYCSTGNHITFQAAKCPGGCGKLVTHTISPVTQSILRRKRHVEELSKRELLREAPGKSEEDLLFYVCSVCKAPFYGGLRHCPRMMGKEPPKSPGELVCESCSCDFSCELHARANVLYKCRLCCNPASHRSFGCYYLCDRCDARWSSSVPEPIACSRDSCPIGGDHRSGSFPIGCGLCPSAIDWSKVVGADSN